MTAAAAVGVVIVDDTSDIRLLLRYALERYGRFSVLGEAQDGAAGAAMVREIRPELVLLDLAMPVMDGLEALSLIRKQTPASRVIMLSGFANGKMAGQVIAEGAAGYVQKGTSATQIVADIANIMGMPVQPRADRSERSNQSDRSGPSNQSDRSGPSNLPDRSGRPRAIADAVDSGATEDVRGALGVAVQELRGPATAVLAMAELLSSERDSLSERSVARMLDVVVRQARVLDRVTDDLLAAIDGTRRSLVVHVQPIRLADSLYAAAFAVSPRQDVTVACPSVLWVRADPTRTQQALGNLLSNALRYGAPPVRIAVEQKGTYALIRVIDRGRRVPTELRPELFRQSTRAPGTTGRGFGVGLYVVRSLVEAEGGRAWYEALDDGGSAFCLSLPVCPPDEVAGALPPTVELATP